jgi:predicted nicotinamide N-methyase
MAKHGARSILATDMMDASVNNAQENAENYDVLVEMAGIPGAGE